MAKTPFLLRRAGKCYFRIRVPVHLVDTIGKKEIKVSLGTSDLREAKHRIALEHLKAQELFANAERVNTNNSSTSISATPTIAVSNIELERTAVLWFKDQEREAEQYDFSARITMSADERFDMLDMLRDDLSGLENEHESITAPAVQPVAKKLLQKKNLSIDVSSKQFHYFCTLIHRALVQLTYNRLARYGDTYDHQSDRMFCSTYSIHSEHLQPAIAPVSSSTITWGESVKQFVEIKKSEGVTKKTLDGYNLIIQFSIEFFGLEKDISTITAADCRELRDNISHLPSNAKKRHPNLTLIEASKLYSQEDTSCLSSTSINNQMRNLSAIFNFAVNEGTIDKNPASNIKKVSNKNSDKPERETFTTEELNKLFRTPLYTGCIDDNNNYNKVGQNHPRGHRFWIPLISLYSGMRLNECCQLFSDDIGELDGVPVIFLRKDPEGIKTFKNKVSLRVVPIHPVLQQIGLIEYAQSMQDDMQKMLFPNIKPSAKGSYSDATSKWFSRFIDSSKLKREGLVFHSLRHTFRDAARDNDLNREAVAKLGGWTVSDDVMDKYGKGHSITRLYSEISKIEYEGLDLDHLIRGS